MTPDQKMLESTRGAMAMALEAGAREVAASLMRRREVKVEWRDGKLERVSEATSRTLALELYVDGRYSAASTKDLRPEALSRFVDDSVALTRTLQPDPHRLLPDPALYRGQSTAMLDLEDAAQAGLTAARRRELAAAAEAGARSVPGAGAIVSVTTGFTDSVEEVCRVHSNGFEGAQRGTYFRISADVSVKDPDGRRPEDGDYAAARHLSSLPDPASVGRRATERALGRVGAKKLGSAPMTVVVEPRAARILVFYLARLLAGSALQQKASCLEGKVGTAVGSPLFDLADDPLVPRGLGSRLFDDEGLAARRMPLFEKGVLRSFYVDTYYGRKLGLAPTTRETSNLAWAVGTKGCDALAADAGDGLLVVGFIGGNSSTTTGDFSHGVLGFRIRGGKLAEPVAEMNIAGNHLELWKRLVAVGNDPWPHSVWRPPTLVFEGVSVAGT